MKPPIFFIAAGGTGGHIYPGLALAEALIKQEPEAQILFVGTPHGLENKIFGSKGYQVLHLRIGRLNRNVSRIERIKTVLQLPFSFVTALGLLFKYRPKAVIGVGGHASGPLLLMASLIQTPSIIWEPNAMPGMANRLLARHVDLACIVFEEARAILRAKRFLHSGLPLRREFEEFASSPVKLAGQVEKLRVLIFGGSQGARGINLVVRDYLISHPQAFKEFEFWHQTGPVDFEKIQTSYRESQLLDKVKVMPYIEDMISAYDWADVVVARAGTGTLAELAALGKASVLIPLPTAADNHQQKNAEAFEAEKAAIMILQKDLTAEGFGEILQRLKTHPQLREELAVNSRKFFKPKAAEKMASAIRDFLNSPT